MISSASRISSDTKALAIDTIHLRGPPHLAEYLQRYQLLRGLLASQRRIVRLTKSCLEFYLGRFRFLRPSHLVEKSFEFTSHYFGDDNHYISAWQQQPEQKPFPVQDTGAPTWVEDLRVLRAFWRLQVFEDLKAAVSESRIHWPEAGIKRLNAITAVGIYDVPIANLLDQDPDVGSGPFVYQQGTLREDELILSVMEFPKTKSETTTITALDFSHSSNPKKKLSERESRSDRRSIIKRLLILDLPILLLRQRRRRVGLPCCQWVVLTTATCHL